MRKTASSRERLWSREARRFDVPPCRILVADDDGEMRDLLCTALARDGFDVHVARDGSELLERLADAYQAGDGSALYDLVISDVRMPGWSGLQVLAGLRDVHGLPVILITAFGDPALHERARRLGAAATLDKPFDIDDLRTVVCCVLTHDRGGQWGQTACVAAGHAEAQGHGPRGGK